MGIPLGYWLSKPGAFYKDILEALLTLPLVLPPSVLGFYLLMAFSPNQAFGAWLQDTLNISLVFSFEGLVVASVIYSLPFMLNPVRAAFSNIQRSMVEASYTMGKTAAQTFFRVLLPNVKYAILSASAITFAHTMGEFGVVLFIGGNISGVTQIGSIALYDSVERMQYDVANRYAAVLLGFSFVTVLSVFLVNKRLVRGIIG